MSNIKPTPTKLSGLFDSSSESTRQSSRQESPRPQLKPLSSPMKTPLRETDYYVPNIPNSPIGKMASKSGNAFMRFIMKASVCTFFTFSFVVFLAITALNYSRYAKYHKDFVAHCTDTNLSEVCGPAKQYNGMSLDNPEIFNANINIDKLYKCCDNIGIYHRHSKEILIYKLSPKTEFIIPAIFTLVSLIFIMTSLYTRLA